MAIGFYGSEFVVGAASGHDYAGAATGLTNGGFVLAYASYPTYSFMNRAYDGLGVSTAGPVSAGTINGAVSSRNGGIDQLSNGMLVEAFSQSGPSVGNPIDVALTTFAPDLGAFPTPVNPGAAPYSSYEYNPTVASRPAGGAIVVWQDDNPVYGRPGINIIAQIFDNNLAGGTSFVVSEPASSGGDQVNADAAGLTNGNYVIVWQDNSGLDGSGAGIRARVFSPTGASVTSEFAVNTTTTSDQTTPRIAALTGGRFVIVWQDQDDVKARVFAANGSALTAEIAVAQFVSGYQTWPDVTELADGGFLVTWVNNETAPADGGDASGTSIKARSFSATGVATSTEILVNSVTTGNQTQPVAATTADGRVVISWTDQSGSLGQGHDVRAQILDPRLQGVTVVGTSGADIYVGSRFADNLAGGDGADKLYGGAGNDILDGGGGSDTLDGGTGADTVAGGAGDDVIIVDNAGDVVIEAVGGGNDRVMARISYVLAAGAEIERLTTASSGATTALDLTGNAFGQQIEGNAGPNRLDGGGGADKLIGYGGDDVLIVDSADDLVVEKVGGGFDRVMAKVTYVLRSGQEIERLTTAASGATTALNLTGNEFGQQIEGNAGPNRLDGGGGADRMLGYGGDDIYIVDSMDDIVFETVGNGYDRVMAKVSYVLPAAAEIERLTTTTSSGIAAIDLTGNGFSQQIDGNAGPNRLDGGGGADRLYGYGGDDVYIVDSMDDIVFETVGNGYDRVMAKASYKLPAAAEIERLTTISSGATTAINLEGNSFSQQIEGNAGANRLVGRGGQDTLVGFAGNDIFEFDSVAETGLGATRDRITDFEAYGDDDTIDLSGFAGTLTFIGQDAFSAPNQVRAIQQGANVLIQINTMGNGIAEGEILLSNVMLAQIDATDFFL